MISAMKKWWPVLLPIVLALAAFVVRIWGISDHFWMAEDQRRDWEVALGPLTSLPLVGSPTHVHGYTIGPAFYWILWSIRVTIGGFFDNLPHAGGIGQAFLESGADALLMIALWRRTGSLWIALSAGVLWMSAPFDLALAPLVWNPTMGATLVKLTLALMLLDWHRRSLVTLAVTAAIAWAAVHVYTGAVFATLAALAAMVFATDRRTLMRRTAVVLGVVLLLQVPYLLYRYQHRGEPVMAAISGGLGQIVRGEAPLNLAGSARGYPEYQGSFHEVGDWQLIAVLLVTSSALIVWRYRRDPLFVWLLLAPQLGAIAGLSIFLGALDSYYYLSLLAIAVATVAAGLLPRSGRPATIAGITTLAAALALVPSRIDHSHGFEMPEYGVLVRASRTLIARNEPLRAIQANFPLPPNVIPGFPYFCMGGPFDRTSPLVAIINADGSVSYNIPR
jgi:hypothetical protein